jgi:fumarylacetoacetate (FAA) hydrolase
LNDASFTPQWLQPNDVVEMTIDGLGHLHNTIKAVESDWSILAQKKMS